MHRSAKNEAQIDLCIERDKLPENVKIILCGSYISAMKELLEEDNPL